MLVSAVARFAVARTFDVPWIAPDEMIYGLVGESLWETGTLSIRGIAVPYYSLLTPALVGLPLSLENLGAGIALAQALQALAMSLVAVPVYLWGERLAGHRWALAAAALAVLPPALWYGGLLMTEALFYTLVTAALLALARLLEAPTVARQGVFLTMVSIAATVRLQALLLLPAFVLAVALHAWFGRTSTTVRRLAPILAGVGLATVASLVLAATGRNDLLGAYGELAETAPGSTGVLSQLTWHSGAVVFMTLGLPFFATVTLAIMAALRVVESSPAVRAFLAAASAYVLLLVGQVSLFAAGYLDHISERYLVTALPLFLLGLCVWIAQGAPRPARVVVPVAAVSILALGTVPASRVAESSAHDALTFLPFVRIFDPGDVAVRGGLVGFGILAAAVFVFLPRRLLPVATAALAIGFVGISALAAREIERFSRLELMNDLGAGDRSWVDRTGVASALHLDTGEQPSTVVARLTFWNRSIRRLVRLEGVPEKALPQVAVLIRRDGTLMDARGNQLSGSHVVLSATHALAGERLAISPPTDIAPGSGLWRVDEPLRVSSRTEGFSPIGDFEHGKVVVYRCSPGALELTLLGKDGLPIRITVNGFPWRTVQPQPGGLWSGSVPPLFFGDGESPCLFELRSDGLVGSTRVEWVPER